MDDLPTETKGREDRLLLLVACLKLGQIIPCVRPCATGNNNVFGGL